MLVPRNSKFVPDYSKNFLAGLTLSNNVSDTSNDIDIATGSCADSSNAVTMLLNSTLTKRLDAAWSAGTNQGGLDTGAKSANLTYHVYLIYNSTTSVTDAIFSTSAVAPSLPSGYAYYRRIGSIMTDGSSNIMQFIQDGDLFTPTTTQLGYAVTNVGTVSNSLITIGFVPTGIRVRLIGQLFCGAINNQSTGYAWLSAAGQTAPAADSTSIGGNGESTIMMAHGAHTAGEASANWHQGNAVFQLMTNTSGQLVLTTATSIGGNVSVRIRPIAWIDTRGK